MQNDTKKCPFCGEEILECAIKCKHCGEWLKNNAKDITVKIAKHQKTSNIIWLIIAIIQICSGICIAAGIWNTIAVISNWSLPEKIKNHDKDIPEYYEGVTGLIIIGIVNLVLGGIIGVLLVLYDFYIRNLVLKNKNSFYKEQYTLKYMEAV